MTAFGTIRSGILLFAVLWLLVGVIYPISVTIISQAVFPWQSNGSLVYGASGHPIGSFLIGQHFSDPMLFWSRPSATSGHEYNAMASGGSNLGPTNGILMQRFNETASSLRASGMGVVPSDLVMSSASGLDPDISLEDALAQVSRVANNTGIGKLELGELVMSDSEGPTFGFIPDQRVDVLKLNLALLILENRSAP